MSKFSNRFKSLRVEYKLSQQVLADRLGLTKSSINMYERGEREPGIETLELIADFFNVDMNYLLGNSDIRNAYSLEVPSDTTNFDTLSKQNLPKMHLKLQLQAFGNSSSEAFSLTPHERKLVEAYRANPAMQPAIDKILNIEEPVSAGTQPGDIAEDIANTLMSTPLSYQTKITFPLLREGVQYVFVIYYT